MKKTQFRIFILLLFASFTLTQVYSQQIGNGYATYTTTDMNRCFYSGLYSVQNTVNCTPDVSTGWQHLFVLRHSTTNNNYQLQIAAGFAQNSRLFFRKIAVSDLVSPVSSPWFEIATRGTNVFTGNQKINGSLYANSIYVQQTVWSDHVFYPGYTLMPLTDLESFIHKNKHLPEVPTTKEVLKNGVNVSDMNALLLKKVEELTLYVIDLQKEIDLLKQSH